MDFFVGLDLGQSQDFTALAVAQKTWLPDPEKPDCWISHYAVRHLKRFPMGTPYTVICEDMRSLFATEQLKDGPLAVDQTGVGRPVVDMLRRSGIRAYIGPITITGGHKAAPDERGGWLVPKRELVSTLQVLLQARRLKIPQSLSDAQVLVQELTNFKLKVTVATNDALESWREGAHDDLVFALAMAAWDGERRGFASYPSNVVVSARPSLAERMASGHSGARRRGLFGLGQ